MAEEPILFNDEVRDTLRAIRYSAEMEEKNRRLRRELDASREAVDYWQAESGRLLSELAGLKKERDQLAFELGVAEARIEALEAAPDDILTAADTDVLKSVPREFDGTGTA